MASTDKTRVARPSAIKEDEQGQLVARKGISREVIDELSRIKGEPEWMRAKRLKSFEIFERKPIPTWTLRAACAAVGCRKKRDSMLPL